MANTFTAPNSISQPLKQYMGNLMSGAVCSHIPDIATSINGAIPLQTFDIAYNTTNDYNGILPNIVSRVVPNPKLFNFNLTPKEFNVQMTRYQILQYEAMTQQAHFATAMSEGKQPSQASINKGVDAAVQGYIMQQLASQVYTRDEKLLHDVITNPSQYNVSNTAAITTAIPSWTKANGQTLLGDMNELGNLLNKYSGNQIMGSNVNEAPEITSDVDLFIVIPENIYNALVYVWATAFEGNQTLMGFDGKGNVGGAYRGATPNLFANAIGFYGAKVIIARQYENISVVGQLDTMGPNFVNMWNGNSIYMFTVSKDILKPASIMKATAEPTGMYMTVITNASYIKTSGIYDYLAPITGNFAKIDLTLS